MAVPSVLFFFEFFPPCGRRAAAHWIFSVLADRRSSMPTRRGPIPAWQRSFGGRMAPSYLGATCQTGRRSVPRSRSAML
jgi:hypothetical protein